MGGIFALANTTSGGLAAHIKLQRPKANAPQPAESAPKPEPAFNRPDERSPAL
jgi:two-component system osmolarity sensor histidine kinase EnvZ